ncbi:MAG: glycoside hydrolase [Phycisphaerae bacterium]
MEICLNGPWQCGIGREYDRTVTVPGLATDPAEVTPGELWYRREVVLPEGEWTRASLVLKGARFAPRVWVNGQQVCARPGGMAPTTYLLDHPDVRPAATVTLEIALTNLDDLPAADASRIPAADRWRSNISSCLWDDVLLVTHRDAWIRRVLTNADLAAPAVEISWDLGLFDSADPVVVEARVQDADGRFVAEGRFAAEGSSGSGTLELPEDVKPWTPDEPNLYRLELAVFDEQGVMDVRRQPLGLRDFAIDGKRFTLNGRPVTVRAGSVVWHSWVRDPESHDLAWDVEWFEQNIVRRLKAHGANCLRFHLGTPPEALLDLCDRIGLLVQAEWLFFHGMNASKESLLEQWPAWLDLCSRHPSVVIHHPWNETEGDQLDTAFSAIEEITRHYPPLIVSHRDVLHVHKYWWSMFENVGLYYDTAEQFPQPIMVDEFGGNYLDGECNPGNYPALKGSFLRFLGPNHSAEKRLWLHTQANCQIAEYWRRLGAAGFSPFCILGPPEDGNHHFLGALADGRPKPVWDALTAAYAPQSVSLEIWDRNFRPGAEAVANVQFFNERHTTADLTAELRVIDVSTGETVHRRQVGRKLGAHDTQKQQAALPLPARSGEWRLEAELTDDVPGVQRPIVSHWEVRTLSPQVPDALEDATVGLCGDEDELRAFAEGFGLRTVAATDAEADVIVTGLNCWQRLVGGGCGGQGLADAIDRGTGVVMLDVGPRELGQGYLEGGDLGPLQGNTWTPQPEVAEYPLLKGVSLRFRELPEPESHLHPAGDDESLWHNLPREATWLWNGLRGGLIVPARDMEAVGLEPGAFVAAWTARGADADKIPAGDYRAYELAGQYAFSVGECKETQNQLRQRVKFLVEDAPALAGAINPDAPIIEHDLSDLYEKSRHGQARQLRPLAVAGKDLVRTPVMEISFAEGCGVLLLSQLLTAGRLAENFGSEGLYGLRPDPAVQQMVLNMLARALQRN